MKSRLKRVAMEPDSKQPGFANYRVQSSGAIFGQKNGDSQVFSKNALPKQGLYYI